MSHKRILQAVIAAAIVLLMVVSLVSCHSPFQTRLDQLQADVLVLEDSLDTYLRKAYGPIPVHTADNFNWNGQTEVWFLLPSQVSPDYLLVSNAVSAMCQANGWTYDRKEIGPETGTALSLLEAAIASGDVGAILYTELPEYLTPFVQRAANEGIIILCLDAETPTPVAGSIAAPTEKMVRETVSLLDRWCQKTGYEAAEENLLPVAVSLHGAASAKDPWPAALLDAIDESSLFFKCRIGISTEENDTVFHAAYLWARSVMQEEPDTRLFCCYTPEAAYGICYYLEQYTADNEMDLADFCVVWNGEDTDSQTYLSVAREDNSYTAARGYVRAGDDAWTTGSMLAYELLGIAHGTELPAPLSDTYALPAENGVVVPEFFGGWLWGEKALSGITVYASFAEKDDLILTRINTPMTDVVNLLEPTVETEEAE